MLSYKSKPFRLSEEDFSLLQQLLVKETGLYFPHNKKRHLELGLKELLSDKEIDSFENYYKLLKSQPKGRLEVQMLAEKLTVQETSFFRNEPQFEALKSQVIPEIVRKRSSSKRSIRIWSAGCSTGEEPYSIAIILRETLPQLETWDISLLATDISRSALEAARHGSYGRRSTQSVQKERLSRFFSQKGNQYVVSEDVRRMVQFSCHNLATDPYDLPAMQAVDIIFCRNVTIYFNLNITKKVIQQFYRKLVEGGYLFIGHSETLWKIMDQFRSVEFPKTFFYRKETVPTAESKKPFAPIFGLPLESREKHRTFSSPGIVQQSMRDVEAGDDKDSRDLEHLFGQAIQALKSKNYEEALSLLVCFRVGDPHYFDAQKATATILSDQGKYEDAITILTDMLREDSLSEETYYLLGVLYNRTDCLEKATEMLKKTLYVNPENPLACFHLAETYLRLSNHAMARKTYHTTLKILETLPADYVIPFSGELTSELLSRTCVKELEILGKA